MAPVKYLGLQDARQAFEDLRPFHHALIQMKMRYKPFGPDYLILDAVLNALNTAAYHFTREPSMYAAKPPRS